MGRKRTYQIMGEGTGITFGTVVASSADEAVDVYAVKRGFGSWYDMATKLGITGRGRVDDIDDFRIWI